MLTLLIFDKTPMKKAILLLLTTSEYLLHSLITTLSSMPVSATPVKRYN